MSIRTFIVYSLSQTSRKLFVWFKVHHQKPQSKFKNIPFAKCQFHRKFEVNAMHDLEVNHDRDSTTQQFLRKPRPKRKLKEKGKDVFSRCNKDYIPIPTLPPPQGYTVGEEQSPYLIATHISYIIWTKNVLKESMLTQVCCTSEKSM